MSDSDFRRIELKSQMLSSEISRLEQSGRSIAAALKKQEQNNKTAESSWATFLRKTISAYKNAPQKLQSQILTSNLKTLSDAKKQIVKQKAAEQNLRSRLESLLQENKRKEILLQHYQDKKRHNLELKSRLKDQNISDEFSTLKSIEIKNRNITASKDAIKFSEPLYDFANSQNPEDSRIVSYSQNNDINPPDSLPGKMADTSVFSPIQNCAVLPSAPFEKSDNSLFREEGGFSDSGSRQHRWESAKDSQELISRQNNAVTVSVLQTSEGDAVCVDYLISPGRMLSLEANQASRTKEVAINLNATKESDRLIINESRAGIFADLRSRGVPISKLEVSQK